jgi:lipopolysaccharide transport system ATP-binding protein
LNCRRQSQTIVSDPIITVENLSKCYRIGHQLAKGDGLRHVLENSLRAPQQWLKNRREKRQSATEEFWALKDVSFEIQRGDAVGVIGRNGAGKSTLLKIMSRITEPTSGRITLDGRVASLLEVGTGFHAELTGRENIFLNGAILGMSKAEIKRKFDEIVAFSEVEKFLDTPVKRYSSGMYVRLAFAVAAHLEPEILIVDEVLAVGDIEFQKKCLGKMEDVSKGGRTVVFVSHNMDAILRMCQRSILLGRGTLQMFGESRLAVAAYAAHRTKQESVIDLTQAARASHPRLKARYASIQLHAATLWSIAYGDQLNFEITLAMDCALSGLELGISIFTATGSEITSNLSSHAFDLKNTGAGHHTFHARYQNLHLLPGSYYVQLGLRSEAGFEDFIPKACEFEVTTSELSSKHKTDTFRGLLVPEVQYDFQ